jgi:phospholipid/cholesterol/gamma-HCH transport system substrate-binding protein
MAQRQSLAWKELRVGILVITSFLLLAAAIFLIGGDTGIFTPKYNLFVFFADVSGLHAGQEVQLEGVTVGSVGAVRLINDGDPVRAVEVQLKLEKKFQGLIHSDAMASIGQIGLLGDQVVQLTRGSADKPPVPENGTISGSASGDIKKIITGTNDIVANLNDMTNTIQALLDKINRGEGTLGMFLNDRSMFDRMNHTVDEVSGLIADARSGNGTVGRLMSDDELYRSVKSTIDRLDGSINKLDGVIDKVNNGPGTIGKFMNDPSLYNKADQAVTKLNTLVDNIDRGQGTIGKLYKDDTIYNDLHNTMTHVNSLVTSIDNGEGTLGKMAKDATLYNSLTQTSSELQKLMYDFRQNPKKYLTINFRLF